MVISLKASAVLDTNAIVPALIFGGQLTPLADMITSENFNMFITRELLQELSRVLSYPKILQVLTKRKITPADIIYAVVQNATIIMAKPLAQIVIIDDPDDDAVLACALTAGVDYIISGDAHLTNLISFCGIPILTPSQFLQEIKL